METGELLRLVLPACAIHLVAHCPCVPDKVLHADLTHLDAHCLMTHSSAAALAFHQYFSPSLPNHLHVFNFLSTPKVSIRVLSGGRAPEVTWTEPR